MFKRKNTLPKAAAVIVAAGSGTRMNAATNKQFILIDDAPVLAHTLTQFQSAETIDEIIIVTRSEDILTASDIVREFGITKAKNIIPGGETRQDSVKCGLSAVTAHSIVAIHDGARPFVSVDKINELIHTAEACEAAAPGVPVKDTVKVVDENGIVIRTPDRSSLRLIQTPQVFKTELIKHAYALAEKDGFTGTDDCSVAEYAQIPVKLIEGEYTNIKITTPEDLPVAIAILETQNQK